MRYFPVVWCTRGAPASTTAPVKTARVPLKYSVISYDSGWKAHNLTRPSSPQSALYSVLEGWYLTRHPQTPSVQNVAYVEV